MQAGLWQSSCPSARLIMQERHSRPRSFCLGVKLCPHALRITWPWPPSLLSSLALSLSTGGGWRWWWRTGGWGGGGIGGVVERRGMQHSLSFFFSTLLFFFPSLFPLHFPLCGSQMSEARKKKERRETGVHLSCKETTTASFLKKKEKKSPFGGP